MAFQPIYGYSGNHPVLDFAGTSPVCMESPNPHADWSFVNVLPDYYPHYATQTISAGEMLLHPTMASLHFSGYIQFFLTYDGNANINCALSWSNSSNMSYVQAECRRMIDGNTVGGGGGIIVMQKGGLTSGSFAVPYYRYRLGLFLNAGGTASMTTADWIKLTVTLS